LLPSTVITRAIDAESSSEKTAESYPNVMQISNDLTGALKLPAARLVGELRSSCGRESSTVKNLKCARPVKCRFAARLGRINRAIQPRGGSAALGHELGPKEFVGVKLRGMRPLSQFNNAATTAERYAVMENDATSRKSALIVAVTGSFITPFMGSSINVALPAIAGDFHIDAVLLSWIPTAYLLAIGITLLPMGKLADIWGRKKIMLLGFIFLNISSLFLAFARSTPALIIFRTIQGFGSGMFFGTTMAVLTSVYPPNERGRVLGITVSAVYVGLSSGPFVGGILTQHLSWRSLFVLTFLMSLCVIWLIVFKLKGEWAEARGETFDLKGALIYALALIVLILAFSLLPDRKSIGMIIFSLLGFAAFFIWERRVQNPIFQVDLLLKNKVFALSNLAALIHYSATFGVTFLMSLYLQYIKGLNAQTAGFVLIAQPVMMALFSPLAGKISDKIEPRLISSAGMMLTFCGLVLLSTITFNTRLPFVVVALFLLGIGFALFSSPNMNAIMSSVDRRYLGVASGSASTMRVLGQLFSMGTATLVLAVVVGRITITAAVYPQLIKSITYILIIFCGLTFAGIFASLARGNVRAA